jgi:hypothetical protein
MGLIWEAGIRLRSILGSVLDREIGQMEDDAEFLTEFKPKFRYDRTEMVHHYRFPRSTDETYIALQTV